MMSAHALANRIVAELAPEAQASTAEADAMRACGQFVEASRLIGYANGLVRACELAMALTGGRTKARARG